MLAHEELAAIAKAFARHARMAKTKELAIQLWRSAKEYQAKALTLDASSSVDIGKPPDGVD